MSGPRLGPLRLYRHPTGPAIATAMRSRRDQVARLGRIREFVFGTQDGLLTTLGVVTGVTGATTSHTTVLIAGLAAALAGMVAMASGHFVSSRSQAQVYRAEIEAERAEVEKDPEGEREEVQVLFEEEGLAKEHAQEIARLITSSQDSWLKTMTEKELGLTAADGAGNLAGAAIIGLSFLAGAAVPILPYVLFAVRTALLASVLLTLAALAALGLIKARLARLNPLTSALEVVLIGSLAALAGYLFGTLIPHLLRVQ